MLFKYHKQQHLQDSQLLNHSKTLVRKIIQLRHVYVGESPVMINMSGCLEVEGPYLSPHPPDNNQLLTIHLHLKKISCCIKKTISRLICSSIKRIILHQHGKDFKSVNAYKLGKVYTRKLTRIQHIVL